MATVLIITREFENWYDELTMEEQESIRRVVGLLELQGVDLGHPYSTKISNSKFAMRELRIQHMGQPYRVLYVFDPVRQAVLLIGGNKVGKGNRWYPAAISLAEKLYAEYLKDIGSE